MKPSWLYRSSKVEHNLIILLLNKSDVFEALISSGIRFQLLNLLPIRCKNEQYVYLLSEDDCQTLVRKLGSLYNEKCPSHYQKRRPILTSEASTARYCNFFS